MPSGVGKHHILATPAAFSEPSHIEGLRKGRVDSASVLSAQAGTYHREASGRGFSCAEISTSYTATSSTIPFATTSARS